MALARVDRDDVDAYVDSVGITISQMVRCILRNVVHDAAVRGDDGLAARLCMRCPACHNATLAVHDRSLLCTWIGCPDPTLGGRLRGRATVGATGDDVD